MLKTYYNGQGGNMIYIDFQAGSHGNYLEFVCNYFLGKIQTVDNPFNKNGAAHNTRQAAEKKFNAEHYFDFLGKRTTPESGKIISIRVTEDDLLPLNSISLLRAGDYNLDNNKLEINTYNKLNQIHYRWVLENLVNSFFKNQIKDSYNNVKDASWPDVNSLADFNNLPDIIKTECAKVHNLQLLELSEEHPDCPRSVLREFFKIGFKDPKNYGFIVRQEKMYYSKDNDVFNFPYSSFYHEDTFMEQIEKISRWANMPLEEPDKLLKLHREFLSRQPYKDSKVFCDQLFDAIITKQQFELPDLDLLQESYLAAKLELHFNKEITNDLWFNNSKQILEYFKQ